MIRDLCLKEIPPVFTKRIYAAASVVDAALYFTLFVFTALPDCLSLLMGAGATVTVRTVATVFRLNMPGAIVFAKEIAGGEE